jgi:predicted glycosyltransferase
MNFERELQIAAFLHIIKNLIQGANRVVTKGNY